MTSAEPCFSATSPLRSEIVFFRSEQGQIAIQIPLQFVVEKHADRSASAALDAGSFLLIEPVEIGVVFDFTGFHQAVVDGLVVGHLVRVLEKAMPGFCERDNAQRLLLRDFKGVVPDQGLACERANVLLHSFTISAVGVLRKVRHSE